MVQLKRPGHYHYHFSFCPKRAPELFNVPSECQIDERTDVWSLGCCLYAMAYGNSPCDGSALSAMSGRIRFPEDR